MKHRTTHLFPNGDPTLAAATVRHLLELALWEHGGSNSYAAPRVEAVASCETVDSAAEYVRYEISGLADWDLVRPELARIALLERHRKRCRLVHVPDGITRHVRRS